MSRPQSTALVICVTCVATLAGQFWIARHAARREESSVPRLSVIDPPMPQQPPRLLAAAAYESDDPVDALRSAGGDHGSAPESPERPLTKRQREEQAAVRAVIEEEMPETSSEERDIWFDELKSLPAEVVRDLLQVRRQLRVLSPDHALSGPSPLHPPQAPAEEHEITAEPVTQSRRLGIEDWIETRQALEQAIAWSTHNLANAATPGYKRIEVFSGDAYRRDVDGDHSSLSGQGCRLPAMRIDLAPGELRETGRPLDLAIDGPGLFVLRDEETGEMVYTRCGRMTSNEQGRLGVERDGKFYLQDANGCISLPGTAIAVKVSAEGSVTSVTDQDGSEECDLGQLYLATCIDPSKLKPIGDGLFAAGPDFAPPLVKPGFRGVGVIRQGFLEQSNVDVVREQAERETWESILRTLPTALVPRTAHETSSSPQ